MTGKSRPKPGSKDYGSIKYRGFINVYLKPHEKAQIKANLLDPAVVHLFLAELTENGYKFSLSKSSDDKTFTATAYCTDFRKANAGLGVSQRHGDVIVAITALQWIFGLEGFDGSWEDVWGTKGDDDW